MVEIDLEEPSVVHSLAILSQSGLDVELLMQCSDADIDSFAPALISSLDAVKLKIAVRKERERRREEKERLIEMLSDEDIYRRFTPVVGILDATFTDDPSQKQFGNCVLVANPGMAITALHVVKKTKLQEIEEEVEVKASGSKKGKEKSKRRKVTKKIEVDVELKEIQVTFPNTHGGVLTYRAMVVVSSLDDDLALIGPVSECLPFDLQFQNLQTLQRWLPYQPEVNDKFILISFPSCKGEMRFSNGPTMKDDLPWFAKGHVSCFDVVKGHGFTTYTSFAGASGSLAIHPRRDGGYRAAIHLGIYHESEEIPSWHASALNLLNESLFQKAYNGYFTLHTGQFLARHFGSDHDPFAHHLHPQVAHVQLKEKMEEVLCVQNIEVLDDLCSPWPGLDDDFGGLDDVDTSLTHRVACVDEVEVLHDLWSPWPGLDDDGNTNSIHRKRKLLDLLGPPWSEDDLKQFYHSYRRYGRNWKKVAATLQNRTVRMVEVLYSMNKAYLSLPDGAASAAGLIALMTDHYTILEDRSLEGDSVTVSH